MSKGYVTFIAIISALWVAMVLVDVIMTVILFRPNFINYISSKIPFQIFVIIPLPVLLVNLYGLITAVWFGIVITVIAIFLAFAIYRSASKFENSSLFRLGEFFALNYFVSIVYFLVIELSGHRVNNPITGTFFSNLFVLTNAGLYEELITRVVYVGIPLFLYYAVSRTGKSSPSRPEKLPWYRVIWGGGYKFGKPEITVLVISSVIFGIAHTPSWGLYKFPQAALGGFFLGILYLRFGLYADVLFHFSVDSPSIVLPVMPTGPSDPIATLATTYFYALVIYVVVAAGIVVFIAYILRWRSYIRSRNEGEIAQTNREVPINVAECKKCGSRNVTFFYDDVYRCNDCGTVFRRDQ